MLTRLTGTTSYTYLIVAFVVLGLGLGLLNPPITNTAVSGMPSSMAGVAAAIASTSRQAGSTLGVAVLGALAGGATAGALSPSFPHDTHVAWWVVVGTGVVVLGLGWLTTTPWALGTARRAAEAFEDEPGVPGGAGSEQPGPQPELMTH
jgi:MFS family permease